MGYKEEDRGLAIEALPDVDPQTKPIDDLSRKADAIAWAYKITIYDALYVAHAEQVGYPLITADEVMVKQLKGHSIVVRLKELEF